MLLTSHLDLELAAPVITGAIQRLFDGSFPCVPGEMVPGLFLDHVEIDPPALTRSAPIPLTFDLGPGVIEVSGYGVDLNIPLTLVFATEAAIRAGGINGPTPVQNLGVIATYRLLGDAAQGAGMQLTFISHTAVTPLPDAQAQQTVMFMLGALFVTQNRFIALPLGGLASLLGGIPPVRNVAVATDTGGTRIVVRVEIEEPGGLSSISWEAFLANPPNHLSQNAWAMVLSPRLVERGVEARIDQQLIDAVELDIDEPTDAHWIAWLPTPMLSATASIEIIDACPIVPGLDIGADIEGSVQISIDNGQLVIRTHIEFDLIDSDVLLCGLGVAFFAPVILAAAGPIGVAIGTGIGLIFNFLFVPVVAQAITEEFPQPPNCSIIDKGDRHVTLECTEPLPVITTPLLGQLTTSNVLGGADGLQIVGSNESPLALTQELTLVPVPIGWAQRFSCASKSVTNEVTGGVGLYGALSVCPPVVLDDPLNFFSAQLVTEPAFRVTIRSDEALRQAYNDEGAYPCHLLIQTNRGVRFVDLGSLGPPPAKPDAAELEGWWIKNCIQALKRVWTDRWHPEWVIDPPPEQLLMHWWRVSVQGLEQGDRLELRVGAREHVSATAEAMGRAGVEAVVAPLQGRVALGRGAVNRRGAVPQFDSDQHRIAVVQTLLVRTGSASLPTAVFGMAVLRMARGELLVTASADALRVWRTGGALALDLAWEGAAQIEGIVTSGAMLVSHGADGLRSWSATAHGTLRSLCHIPGHFARAVAARGCVATLCEGELQMFDPAGLRRLSVSRAPAHVVEEARAALARQATLRAGGMRAPHTCTPADPSRRTFASDQWFTAAVRINRHTLARLEEGGVRIDVYRVGSPVPTDTILPRHSVRARGG